MNSSDNQSAEQLMPDADTASYWLGLGILLLLLVLGRAATHTSVALPIRHAPATIATPVPNGDGAQKSSIMSVMVSQ